MHHWQILAPLQRYGRNEMRKKAIPSKSWINGIIHRFSEISLSNEIYNIFYSYKSYIKHYRYTYVYMLSVITYPFDRSEYIFRHLKLQFMCASIGIEVDWIASSWCNVCLLHFVNVCVSMHLVDLHNGWD